MKYYESFVKYIISKFIVCKYFCVILIKDVIVLYESLLILNKILVFVSPNLYIQYIYMNNNSI